MPKINIYPPTADGEEPTDRLEVGWHPNGVITVASRRRNPVTVLTDSPDVQVDTGDEWDGWTSNLDRAGANALIRAVRVARDKAFGRDA